MKDFENESQRYDYPLDAESFVMDCGAYEGNFARALADKYHCTIWAFEPCGKHMEIAKATCLDFDEVKLMRIGVGGRTRTEWINVRGDTTGFHNHSSESEIVAIMELAKILTLISAPPIVGLIKLNVEGSEYEILEHAIRENLLPRFRHIQIQWHDNVADFEYRREVITRELLKTHVHAWGLNPRMHQSFSLR